MVSFSISVPPFAIKSADVLVQLLQSEVAEEEETVTKTLLALFRQYPKDCTAAILGQIHNGSEVIRDVSCSFIRKHLLNELQPKMKVKLLEKLIPVHLV